MIETYAFLATFAIQILVGSVLGPALFIRRIRPAVAHFPVKRFAELFPGVDRDQSGERFATRFRAANTAIAVLGLLLLCWLFIHMQRPDWTEETAVGLLVVYFFSQLSPSFVIGWKTARSMKMLKSSLADGKRKAVLRRRGLFDFISPVVVFLAGLSYVLVVALVLYIRQHPLPGSGGLTNIVFVTLVWLFFAFLVYGSLYGRNRVPMAPHAVRLDTIGVVVRTIVYTCIGFTVFTSLELTLGLLHLTSWGLFVLGVFFMLATLGNSLASIRRPRPAPQTDHTEIALPVADLDKCVGRFDFGNGFVIAIASDGTTLWWLRLGISIAYPVRIFPEAPLAFFWKDIDQQIRFGTDAGGVVTGAEITQGGHVSTGKRVGLGGFPPFSRPTEYGCKPA
jgi:hypothetical protein